MKPIDFCIIPPLANLNLMNQGKRIFALGQLYLRYDEYQNFIHQKKEEGWFIIMDNGAGDHGDIIDQDVLIEIADTLRPSEIIPLDILFDANATIENAEIFIEKMKERDLLGKVKILFVPQGNTKEEWLACYEYALNNPHIDTIGISKIGVPHAFLGKFDNDQNTMRARHLCYDHLLANDLLKKPLHFLGAENCIEFQHYKHPMARSTDSCFSVLAAINNLNWKSYQTTRIPTPKNYFTDLQLQDNQLETFVDNVEILANMCQRD